LPCCHSHDSDQEEAIRSKPADEDIGSGLSHPAGSGKITFLESLVLKSTKKNKTSDVNQGVHIEAVITDAGCGGVLFYFINDVTTNNSGPWPEKLTADALCNSGAWVQEIGIQDEVYKLIINGVEVRNNHGYFKRGFFILLDEMPTPDTMLQMMSFAADNLNATPGNTVPTSVDMASLFPLGCDPVVWSTFIGDEKACQLCLEHTVGPGQVLMPGYWELHSSFVKVHFPSPLTPQLAHFFHAPVEDETVETEDMVVQEQTDRCFCVWQSHSLSYFNKFILLFIALKLLFLEHKTGPYAEIHDWILFSEHKAGPTQTRILLSLF
jgi:hypothetical protein